MLLTLPAALALAILATPLISTLFYHGEFSANDVWMTRHALVAYSVGLLGLILVKVLAPGFYARQNIKTPVKIAVITLTATQLMNLAFIIPLQHAGLALAIGLGACLNAGAVLLQTAQPRNIPAPARMGNFHGKDSGGPDDDGHILWFGSGNEVSWLAGSSFRPRVTAWKRRGNRGNKLFQCAVATRFPPEGFCQTRHLAYRSIGSEMI